MRVQNHIWYFRRTEQLTHVDLAVDNSLGEELRVTEAGGSTSGRRRRDERRTLGLFSKSIVRTVGQYLKGDVFHRELFRGRRRSE